jgi:hypothetical protein
MRQLDCITEGCYLHLRSRRRENLKSQEGYCFVFVCVTHTQFLRNDARGYIVIFTCATAIR